MRWLLLALVVQEVVYRQLEAVVVAVWIVRFEVPDVEEMSRTEFHGVPWY